MQKVFIGYDLGDGESITDYCIGDSEGNKIESGDMTMPGMTDAGKAIPTVFGYNEKGQIVFANAILKISNLIHDIRINFKRRPSDLCRRITAERQQQVLKAFQTASRLSANDCFPPESICPECHTQEMEEFRETVKIFTNAIFNNQAYKDKVKSAATDSDDITFIVGHPTRWNELDVAIYKTILSESVLGQKEYAGKPTSLMMAAESRAAFLTVKYKATERVLPKGTYALLLDVGSSTIDITALTPNSNNFVYNSGNNYLGARSIDFIIRKRYLEYLRSFSDKWEAYQDFKRSNIWYDESLLLRCRKAKEEMYSSTDAPILDIAPRNLAEMVEDISVIENYIKEYPVAEILSERMDLPIEEKNKMGNKNWMQLFRDFLTEEKDKMSKNGIKIGRIILTGSASKMSFVPEIVKEVFSELANGGVLADMNPSRTISKGLAWAGLSDVKSKAFQKDINNIIDNKLPGIIYKDMENLAESLSAVIEEEIKVIVKDNVRQWRNGSISTLERMTKKIEEACGEEKLQKRLMNNKAYNNAISKWMTDVVGKDIALELKAVCEKYKVNNMTLDNLNIFKTPNIGNVNVDVGVLDFADIFLNIVVAVAGIITMVVLPTVVSIVIGLISYISLGLAILISEILLAIPAAGWTVLCVFAGVAVIKAAASGLEDAKDFLNEKIQGADLPQWVRNRVKDEKIDQKIKEAGIGGKIKAAILEEDSKKNIVNAVSASLRGQVEKRAESIKYEIESM